MAFIIDDLLLLPVRTFTDIVKKIRDMAENELYGEDKIKEELSKLQMMLETEKITEDEYNKAEAILLERLEKGAKIKRGRGEG